MQQAPYMVSCPERWITGLVPRAMEVDQEKGNRLNRFMASQLHADLDAIRSASVEHALISSKSLTWSR